MKLLLLADKESPYLWDYYQPGRLSEYDLMLSCGDLKAEYPRIVPSAIVTPTIKDVLASTSNTFQMIVKMPAPTL